MTVSHTQPPSPAANAEPRVLVHVYALTDVGQTREHNEDTFLVADLEQGARIEFDHAPREVQVRAHGLMFLVADGMGGAASGELASGMAVDVLLSSMQETWRAGSELTPDAFATALRDATEMANRTIHQYAKDNPEHRGMGTTATVAGLFGDRLFVAQVGDSRAYLVRGGDARQLTKDQSLMQRLVEAGELTQEEADASDRRNIILQALGPDANISVDLTHQQVRRGDTLILCSDGLSGLVRADEIARLASDIDNVETLCQRLVNQANDRGGPDNITVIAARFGGDALATQIAGDQHGYSVFPLGDGSTTEAVEARIPQSRIRSDPTPRFGTPTPSRASIEAEVARLRALADEAAAAAPTPQVIEDRRRRAKPVFLFLLVAGVLAALWFLVRMFFPPTSTN